MNPNQTVAEHIDHLHKKVKALKLEKLADEAIIAVLKKEDGVDDLYAQILIDNTESDKRDKKDFGKLIIAAVVAISAGIFVLLAPQFDGFRQGWVYWLLVWAPLGGGAIFLTRAFVLFKR
jgi:hypothetical protein